MEARKFHEIWIEQCEAAEHIRRRYGTKAAFDYLVAEKLLNFADAATMHPAFARELPRFVARVRGLFTADEIWAHFDRIDREAEIDECNELAEEDKEEDALSFETNGEARERARQFATIAELLTAAELGTS